MKKFIAITAATLACAALIPASFARKTPSVQQIPTRPVMERFSRRTLINKTIQSRAVYYKRGTHGVTPNYLTPASSAGSSSSAASTSSSSSSASSGSSSSASSK